jgi:hypothetical protein
MKILGMINGVVVSALSADLLYLYFDGAWTDPNNLIRLSELSFLFIFALGGILYMIWNYISMFKTSK